MHRCVYWLLKVFLIFIYSGKVWQAMQIKMDMWTVGNFLSILCSCPVHKTYITSYYNTLHMCVYVLCSFLLPKARSMTYWQSSSKPIKSRTRCAAKRTLSLADELLFVLMRLKVMTTEMRLPSNPPVNACIQLCLVTSGHRTKMAVTLDDPP